MKLCFMRSMWVQKFMHFDLILTLCSWCGPWSFAVLNFGSLCSAVLGCFATCAVNAILKSIYNCINHMIYEVYAVIWPNVVFAVLFRRLCNLCGLSGLQFWNLCCLCSAMPCKFAVSGALQFVQLIQLCGPYSYLIA